MTRTASGPARRPSGDVLEQLYAVPPEEFVAERSRLARSLRDAGRNEDAAELAGRRKPSLPVFAANAVARKRASDVARLLDAAEDLRKAHAAGEADALRDAQARLGEAVRSLVVQVADVTAHRLSDAHEQRLATTLREAALDPEASELLRRGVLTNEVESSGFDLLAGLGVPEAPRRPPGRSRAEVPPRAERKVARTRALEDELSEAKHELREASRALAGAERGVARAQKRVDRIEERLARARASEF